MIKRYKINKHNSTVCGSPGRYFDWTKFDWNSQTRDVGKAYIKTGEIMNDLGNKYPIGEIFAGRATIQQAVDFMRPIRSALYNPVYLNITSFKTAVTRASRLRI